MPTTTRATTFWGGEMQVVLPELVSCEIHLHGVIEPGLTALMVELVSHGTVVYDVGAHLGYHSSLAAALGGKVHAFEPSKETLPLLRANLRNRATIVPTALWDRAAALALKDFGAMHSALNTFLSPKDDGLDQPDETYSVQAMTLDGYVAQMGDAPRLVKIDAEGAELQVLRGGKSTLRDVRPYVTVEVGDTLRQRTTRRALEFALECDYVPYEFAAGGLRRHTIEHAYAYGNVLLLPRGEEPPPLPLQPLAT